MEPPRWHDWVIALSILALAGIGVVAIWGQEIEQMLTDRHAPSDELDSVGSVPVTGTAL